MGTETTAGYDLLYDVIRRRSSIRKLKPDPIPDEYINKILEAGRWAMSGANSQPWEYIVVKDPQVKKDLFRCYTEVNADFIYWMEQQRVFELRHPAYQMTADKAVEQQRRGAGADRRRRRWAAPVGHGARRPYFRARPVAPHGRSGEHLYVDASSRGISRSWHAVGHDSYSGAIQESLGRAGFDDVVPHYSNWLSSGGALGGRAAPLGGNRSP